MVNNVLSEVCFCVMVDGRVVWVGGRNGWWSSEVHFLEPFEPQKAPGLGAAAWLSASVSLMWCEEDRYLSVRVQPCRSPLPLAVHWAAEWRGAPVVSPPPSTPLPTLAEQKAQLFTGQEGQTEGKEKIGEKVKRRRERVGWRAREQTTEPLANYTI